VMLPGFVERSEVIASLPSLSLLTLAALTPERHEVEYAEVMDLESAGPLDTDCDLVAISSLSAQIGEAYALADRYRAAGVAVVMGGLHVTSRPEEALLHCDAVVVGEGEPVWAGLLRDFEAGRLRATYRSPDPRGFDLAQAPIPRFDLLEPERYNRLTVQTSRGCPHKCEFCASSILLTERYKVKPPERVMREIDAIRSIWPRPFVEFADDNSFVDRGQARRLMELLAPEEVPWFTELDIAVADDPELVALMRDAGCRSVLIGLESPTPDALDGLELRSNWKRRHFGSYQENVGRLQAHGIGVIGCFVLGLDGQTPEIFAAVLDFARQLELSDVQVTLLTPFPGTPLYERLRREGRLTHPGVWERCTLFDLNFDPRGMSGEELQQGFLALMADLYSEEVTRARKRRFRRLRRSSPEARRRPVVHSGGRDG
ncbi:MAG: radical SAM protein, partial [Gemmatimonadota bacterium]